MRITKVVDHLDGRCELTIEFDDQKTANLVKAMVDSKNLPKPCWKDAVCRSCRNTGRDFHGKKCVCGADPQFILIDQPDED